LSTSPTDIHVTPYGKKLLPICEELGQTAFKIAGQVNLTITEHKLMEPKLLALALLCRTLGNFKGAVRLVQQGLLVEARVLARCCFENLFMIGGLYAQGREFAEKTKADDIAGRKNRAKFIEENEGLFVGITDETRIEMSRAIESLGAIAKSSYVKFKDVSQIGPFKEMYLAYSSYSGDAAHPTFTALMRHLAIDQGEAAFDVVPEPFEEQLDETLHLSCIALLSAAVAVNEMFGYTDAGKHLPVINGKLKALQDEKFGEKVGRGESLEIKTGLD
jgi:hypothetical protein